MRALLAAVCVLGVAGCARQERVRPERSTWDRGVGAPLGRVVARDAVASLLSQSPDVSGVAATDSRLVFTYWRAPFSRGMPRRPLRTQVRLADVSAVMLRAESDHELRACLVLHDGGEHVLPAQQDAAATRELVAALARYVDLRPYSDLPEDDFPPTVGAPEPPPPAPPDPAPGPRRSPWSSIPR